MAGGIALLLVPALIIMTVKQAGKRVPIIRRTGLDVVATLLLPAWLVSTGILNAGALGQLDQWFEQVRVLDWFVAIIVIGSLAEVDLRQLGRVGASLPVPAIAGSLAALGAGTLAATIAGAGLNDALFLSAAPVMAGGIAVGAMPLASGYADIRGTDAGEMLGLLLPAVVLGNLLAILLAATMRKESDDTETSDQPELPATDQSPARLHHLILALAVIVALQLLARLGQSLAAIPASLSLIVLVLLFRLTALLPEWLRLALIGIYRQCVRWLLFPILVLVGLLVLPWSSVVAGLAPPTLAAATTVTLCLALSGRAFAGWMRMRPSEGGTLFLARAAMGGSGNLTILGAANRMELMPLALLLTRIGGLLTVAVVLALMRLI